MGLGACLVYWMELPRSPFFITELALNLNSPTLYWCWLSVKFRKSLWPD